MATFNFKCAFRDMRNREKVLGDHNFTRFSFPSSLKKLSIFASQFHQAVSGVIDCFYSSGHSYQQDPSRHEIKVLFAEPNETNVRWENSRDVPLYRFAYEHDFHRYSVLIVICIFSMLKSYLNITWLQIATVLRTPSFNYRYNTIWRLPN